MLTFKLSDTVTKVVCLLCDALLVAALVFLALRGSVLWMALAALVFLMLLFYTLDVFAACVSVQPDKRRLTVRHMFARDEFDVSDAASVALTEFTEGSVRSSIVSIKSAGGTQLCAVRPYMNAKGGSAEKLAKDIADALGIQIPADKPDEQLPQEAVDYDSLDDER